MSVLDEMIAERRAKMDADERARIASVTEPLIEASEAEVRARIVEHGAEVLAKVEALAAADAMKDSQ